MLGFYWSTVRHQLIDNKTSKFANKASNVYKASQVDSKVSRVSGKAVDFYNKVSLVDSRAS